MQQDQKVGVDLPLKTLVWQDAAGQVWLTYDDPRSMAARHDLSADHPVIVKMTEALRVVTRVAGGGAT